MSQKINTVLAECESRVQQLIMEIEKYKTAKILSNEVATALEEICHALKDTHSRIQPFTSVVIKRFLIALMFFLSLNTGLLIAVMIMVARK